MKSFVASAILAFASTVSAHMAMTYPPPLRSKENPFSGSDIDYSITSPLSASGSDFPCKGTLNLLGTKAASSVATWSAGSTHNMTIAGGANHGGGSCQASLSYDNGKTFTVIHSYIGNCPTAGTSSYDFTVPSDAKAGEALFAWTWFNKIGNREMYMNCAVVTIDGASSSSAASSDATAFSTRPEIMVANVGNGCSTKAGGDTEFPDPGPDVSNDSTDPIAPVGNCGPSSGSGSGSGSSSTASSVASSAIPTTSTPAYATATSSAKATSTPYLGGIFLTKSETMVSQVSTTLATATRPATVSGFIPTGAPATEASAATNAPAATEAPATTEAPAATDSPIAKAPTATSSAVSPTGSATSVGLQTVGSACSDEGAWNCVSGTAFQRCASGEWSAAVPMASGTVCQAGVRADLVMLRARALRI
ncbi:hypothetical protein TD95_001983 [Thielaviopsis punctulata]|uniref:Chitin-binding type-4 domain-containing protein n=1 Tax=Thielaviopsis punctulata TaxID=72032 RepID=A0A0F4ZB03_9PEZI|nr:hypothetical protein TD95_001983 [Thielaviopsis punctulata]